MYINGQKLNLKRFSGGELKILKSELEKYVKNNHVQILYAGEESFLELLIILRYYNYISTKIDLVLSYLPYQRMDHKGRDELDTVNYVADILNDLKLNSITICEPHCGTDMFKKAKEFSYVEHIKQKVFAETNFDENNDTIVLTDKGGLKRYGDLTKNVVYFNKVRDMQTGLIVKHEILGTIEQNSKCIIVDDIISTGDTILNVVEYLKAQGVKDIYIMCGHYEKNKYNKRLINCDDIQKIYSTNSLSKRSNKKLKLFDVKELLWKR